ncbi:MAG: ribosome-recycling factor [Candidatus Shikimatogenerans bostrichidophilus]|nr:MAG: ribosome-recycling factor [Candidatus Shikimatogenerans bostrichidophilus]
MNDIEKKINLEFNKSINYFKKYLLNIHYGKVSTSMLKDIYIKINNKNYNIYSLANINIIDKITLEIIPYDIENKKILRKKINLVSNNLGTTVIENKRGFILKISSLTEERRKELINKIKKELENIKNTLRIIRNKFINNLKKEKKKSIDYIEEIKEKINNLYKEKIIELNNLFNEKKKEVLN